MPNALAADIPMMPTTCFSFKILIKYSTLVSQTSPDVAVVAAAVVVVVAVSEAQQQHVETECILNQSVVVLEEGFGAKLRLGTSDGREKIGWKV